MDASGSPILDGAGQAVGLLTHSLGLPDEDVVIGTSLQDALASFEEDHGAELRLVPGEAFHPERGDWLCEESCQARSQLSTGELPHEGEAEPLPAEPVTPAGS